MSKANKAGPATAPPKPPRRLNPRALVVLVAVPVVAVPVLIGLRVYQGRKSMPSYLDAAQQALDKGDASVALSYVNNYLQGEPKNVDALELRGRILTDFARDLPTVQEAIRVQTQILALDPNRMEAWKRLIELNLKAGLYRAAQAAAQEYLKHGADDAEAHRLMARALEGVGYFGDTKALDGDPADPKAPSAIAEYEKAERLKPGDVDGGYRLAELYVSRSKDPVRAVGVMDTMLATNPKSVTARLNRFRFFVRHPELAAKSSEATKAQEAFKAEAAKAQAAGKAQVKVFSLAKYELGEALKLAPGDADAGMLAAEEAVGQGETTDARRYLAQISPPPKDELRLNLIKGMIEFKEQRPDEAIQSWRAGLVQTGGSNKELHWRLARVLIGLNRIDQARQHMAQYRRLAGGKEPDVEYRYLESLINLRAGRVKEALAELEAIRDKVPARSPLTASQQLIALGDAYAASRDEAKAIDTYTQAANAGGAGRSRGWPWPGFTRLPTGRPTRSRRWRRAWRRSPATRPCWSRWPRRCGSASSTSRRTAATGRSSARGSARPSRSRPTHRRWRCCGPTPWLTPASSTPP